jgi:hypothetical protein
MNGSDLCLVLAVVIIGVENCLVCDRRGDIGDGTCFRGVANGGAWC